VLSASEHEHLSTLNVEFQDVGARHALLLREEIESRDVNLDPLEAVHVAGADHGVDIRDWSQQRVGRGCRKRVQRASTRCGSEGQSVKSGPRVCPEAVGQHAKGRRMRLEGVTHCRRKEVEIVGRNSAVVSADVDDDRGVPDDIDLIHKDVLGGEPAFFDPAG
jgi:hypothetical protein